MAGHDALADDAVDALLENVADLRTALRLLLEHTSLRRNTKKTLIISEMASSRTWYAHQSGEWKIGIDSLRNYSQVLANTPYQRNRVLELFTSERAETKNQTETIHGIRQVFSAMLAQSALNKADLKDYIGIISLIDSTLDARHIHVDREMVIGRIRALQWYIVDGHRYNDITRAKIYMHLAFAVHLNAYFRDDWDLQKRSLQILKQMTGFDRHPYYQYVFTMIEAYWMNRQDRSVFSTDSMPPIIRQSTMRGFKIGATIAEHFKSSAKEEQGVDGNHIYNAMKYNIASFGIEIDDNNRAAHELEISNIQKMDEENGTSISISVFNDLAVAEALIRQGGASDAFDYCADKIKAWEELSGAETRFQFQQLKIKQMRSLMLLRTGKTTRIDDQLMQISKEIINSTPVKENPTLTMELEMLQEMISRDISNRV